MTTQTLTNLNRPLSAQPRAITIEVLLTARTPISHHDPAVQDASNVLLFNRRRQFLPPLPASPSHSRGVASDAVLDAFLNEHRAPGGLVDLLLELPPADFCAVCLVRTFIDLYNSRDGTGLFEGPERYRRLEERLRLAAVRSHSFRSLWDRLTADLHVPVHPVSADAAIARFWQLDHSIQSAALRALTRDYRSLTTITRAWHAEARPDDAGNRPDLALVPVTFGDPDTSERSLPIEVPAISDNSLRHQLIREPGYQHLLQSLDLFPSAPGQGLLPAGAAAIFENGGNIAAGAKQPSDPFGKALRIREAFPLLDLVGGTTDSFDIGESRLAVSSWLVCRENALALEGTAAAYHAAIGISAFDLLDETTITRQATEQGRGQMIVNFETLCPGTPILVRFQLPIYTSRLTQGAFWAALETFIDGIPVIGGQSARGFGFVGADLLQPAAIDTAALVEYEQHLAENRDALRACLTDGTLVLPRQDAKGAVVSETVLVS